MRKYRWKRSKDWSGDIGLKKLMALAATRVVTGRGPFTLTQDGDDLVKNRSRKDVLERFRVAISHREIGSTFRIRKGNGTIVFTARAVRVEETDDSNSTSGNSKCDILYNAIKTEFRSYNPRYAGAYVCKRIAGTWQLSQHSYGNAVDVFFNTMDHQHRVAQWVVANASKYRAYHVITGNSIWTKGSGWRRYYGVTHYHLHVDFDPQYSGSCGVRG